MARKTYRRVVTGLNEAGRSCVLFDGHDGVPGGDENPTLLMWKTAAAPASNAGTADAADAPTSFDFPRGGSKFVLAYFPPGLSEHNGHRMHASNTLDYGVLLSGRLTMVLEDGEVDLEAGDLIIDRGVLHGWRNTNDEDAVIVWSVLDAEPVGAGATI